MILECDASEGDEMDNIIAQIQYWMDYKGSGDTYRKKNDLDCILTGGNLNADSLISLWLPLRYVLNKADQEPWRVYSKQQNLKKNADFLKNLKENLQLFIPDKYLLNATERLFTLGRTRANVIILPYRKWNVIRGGSPYWDYFPHFLYDLLCTEDKEFLKATQDWIEAENLQMFFNEGNIVKENLRDLWGTGNVRSHKPSAKNFNPVNLINQYSDIIQERKNCMERTKR